MKHTIPQIEKLKLNQENHQTITQKQQEHMSLNHILNFSRKIKKKKQFPQCLVPSVHLGHTVVHTAEYLIHMESIAINIWACHHGQRNNPLSFTPWNIVITLHANLTMSSMLHCLKTKNKPQQQNSTKKL